MNNNYSKNIRISETPKAIRTNKYNEYTGKFSSPTIVANGEVNDQKISTVFNIGKKTIIGKSYPEVNRPPKPIVISSQSSLTSLITLIQPNDGGSPITEYKVYANSVVDDPLVELTISFQASIDDTILLYLSTLLMIGSSFQVTATNAIGESPRSDLISIIDKVTVPIPGTPFTIDNDIWQ